MRQVGLKNLGAHRLCLLYLPRQFPGAGGVLIIVQRHIERLPVTVEDDLALPELAFAFFDRVVAFDAATGRTWLVVSGADEGGLQEGAAAAMDWIANLLPPGN